VVAEGFSTVDIPVIEEASGLLLVEQDLSLIGDRCDASVEGGDASAVAGRSVGSVCRVRGGEVPSEHGDRDGVDLRAFFAVIDKSPLEVTTKDVFEFIAAQRRGRGDGRVVRLSDGEAGLAARTIRRRLAVMSNLFNYLVMCGEMAANPVPRGMASRRTGAGGQPAGSPLIRTPRTLPRVLDPADVILLLGAVRHWRDRAMVEAMVLGGLRCCEVIGLRLGRWLPGCRRRRGSFAVDRRREAVAEGVSGLDGEVVGTEREGELLHEPDLPKDDRGSLVRPRVENSSESVP
jgi:hypothetical protein